MITTPRITESEFTRQVLECARLHGWISAHFRPALTARGTWRTAVQGDGAGFPDVILVRGGVLIAAELKVGKNKPTEAQRRWLDEFAACGVRAAVWTPADWSEIEEAMR